MGRVEPKLNVNAFSQALRKARYSATDEALCEICKRSGVNLMHNWATMKFLYPVCSPECRDEYFNLTDYEIIRKEIEVYSEYEGATREVEFWTGWPYKMPDKESRPGINWHDLIQKTESPRGLGIKKIHQLGVA